MTRAPAFVTGEDPAYYAVLGVASNAGQEEIAAAYRALMRRHHPDAAGTGRGAEELAKRINEAFSVLGHPDLRAQYDAVHGYPRSEEASPAAAIPVARKSRPAPPPPPRVRRPTHPPAEEHGASAMMLLALFIAVAAVVLVGALVALAREQRAEVARPRLEQSR